MFLVYKLEAFKNCKEVTHIMIMTIAIIYIFLSYVIFHEQVKISFRKSSAPPHENFSPPLQLKTLRNFQQKKKQIIVFNKCLKNASVQA